MDYFLFNFSGVQFHYTMSHIKKYRADLSVIATEACTVLYIFVNPALLRPQ